jgi:hypothetical protein
VHRRAFVKAAAAGIVGLVAPGLEADQSPRRLLYNGIRLPAVWPPRLNTAALMPITPPYLLDPPAVIPIDVGRQLFVDDFLIETMTLTRRYHHAVYASANPVLRPETAWETFDSYADRTGKPPSPTAMVFSDGVFYDPAARLYKMWYLAGYSAHTCCAVSEDGVSWTRPRFDVKPGTNIVMTGVYRDSNTVWLDHDASDPAERFKMATYSEKSMLLYASADGIHWRQCGQTGPTGDRSTMFYNAFLRKWVFSIRDEDSTFGRMRRYWETDDFCRGANWREGEPPYWVASDGADLRRADYGTRVQLYNLDAVAYESVMLGLFTMWRGEEHVREKPNDVCVGFSRDGFHWWRPDRQAFIAVSEHAGDWNWANVQSAGGCCLVVDDVLRFYVSGRAGVPGTSVAGVCSTGLATLRRDGFASLEPPAAGEVVRRSPTAGPNTVVTRPVRFSGRYLFVNADLRNGPLRVQIEDVDGRPLTRFSLADSVPVDGDRVAARVVWRETGDLGPVAGRPVRFRFEVGGRLYAFWVSRSERGESGGYVAAGGPQYRGSRDE